MDILVLGGTGFLSSAVVAELQQAEHRVTILTRGRRPVPQGVAAITADRHDLPRLLQELEGRPFDAVVDCICFTAEDAQADLRAFAGRVGHFFMISTDFVYGRHRVLPADEDTPPLALNGYGRQKGEAEAVLQQAWREEGFPVTILRAPHIMGAGGHLGTGSLQGRDPALLDRLEQGAPIILIDGGQLLIQPVVHRDVGRAVAAALGKEPTLGQAYNVAGPDCVTTRAYYDLVAATLGIEEVDYLSLPAPLYVQSAPEKAPFTLHRMYSVDKLERDTGYRPDTTLQHAVFETVDWLQEHDAAAPYEESARDRETAALCRAFEHSLVDVLRETC